MAELGFMESGFNGKIREESWKELRLAVAVSEDGIFAGDDWIVELYYRSWCCGVVVVRRKKLRSKWLLLFIVSRSWTGTRIMNLQWVWSKLNGCKVMDFVCRHNEDVHGFVTSDELDDGVDCHR